MGPAFLKSDEPVGCWMLHLFLPVALCVRAFEAWRTQAEIGHAASRAFCEENFLSKATLEEIRDLRVQVSGCALG
jgi:hypothetical protein